MVIRKMIFFHAVIQLDGERADEYEAQRVVSIRKKEGSPQLIVLDAADRLDDCDVQEAMIIRKGDGFLIAVIRAAADRVTCIQRRAVPEGAGASS